MNFSINVTRSRGHRVEPKSQAEIEPLDPPNPGTKCFPCYLHNHFCQATTWYYEVPVCQPCKTGQICTPRLSLQRLLKPIDDWKAA